jgi:lipopolysaccharide export system protein LptC
MFSRTPGNVVQPVLRDIVTAAFPIGLMLILAALSYWLNIVATADPVDIGGRFRHDPDTIVKHFDAISYDEAGNRKAGLRGAELRHFPDDESSVIQKPLLQRFTINAGTSTVNANQAVVNSDGSEVDLTGDVKAVRPAQGGKPALTLTAPHMHVLVDEERARTPGFARVQQGSSWISGTGFEADNVTQTFSFHSNVNGSYKR